jgi:menaquinol-cytochrome c reductase iron-sulfur subunit
MDPVPNPPPAEPVPERRRFFRWLTYGLGAVAAAVLGVPFLGFLFGARRAPVRWQPLGPVASFPEGQTRRLIFDNPIRQPWDGMVANASVYVRYEGLDRAGGHQFLVLDVNCAHLGCPVEWFEESGLFLCPCHGGVYYASGEHASGPPPRGLFRCVYRVVTRDGAEHLEIQAPHFPTLQDTLDGEA